MKRVYSTILPIISALVLMVSLIPAPSQAAYTPFTFTNAKSGKCLTVRGGFWDNWTPIDQYTCLPSHLNQQFIVEPSGIGSTYYLKPMNAPFGDKCLSVANLSADNGMPTIIWNCQGTANQLFTLRYISPTAPGVQLVVASSGKCLQVNGASMDNSALVTQWTCGTALHFFWKYKAMPDPRV
jgi:endoglucanase